MQFPRRALLAGVILAVLTGCGSQQASVTTSTGTTTEPAGSTVPTPASDAPAESATTPSEATSVAPATSVGATAAAFDLESPPQPPQWAQGATIYQLFVRAFTPEGTFAAATAKLPEVKDLGVDIIYLLPIHPIGQERRKGELGSPYSIRDHRAIDPELGTEEDFRAFVDTAHTLGMRVILDLVANHTAWDNPLITEHPDWYTRNDQGQVIPPDPEWTDVADLNYDNPDLRQYMIDTSRYWVDTFGIDGYRCDVSDRVPSDFWLSWRAALKADHPDLLLLSESGGIQMYEAGFEVAYDWTTRNDFIKGLLTARLGRGSLSATSAEQRQFGDKLWRMRYLENHDHDRIAAGMRTPEQTIPAAAFLLTLPGLPLVYAGQEVGATERPSLFDRFTVNFASGDQQLREVYKELIQLRKNSPALRSNVFERVQNETRTVLLYERKSPEQRVLVAINMDKEPVQVVLDNFSNGRHLRTGEVVDLSGGLQIDGYGYQLIEIS
jgi:glycosidase